MLAIACVFLAQLFVARRAQATLREDARRIEELGRVAGLSLVARRTAFVEDGDLISIVAPAGTSPACRSVVVIGTRGARFGVTGAARDEDIDEVLRRFGERREPGPGSEEGKAREAQVGLVELSGCGADAAALEALSVRMLAGRGALEVLVFEGRAALPSLAREVGRDPGRAAPRGDPGPPLSPARLSERRARAELAAREDGATNVLWLDGRSAHEGSGELELRAGSGCHRLSVFAATEGIPLDLDAELRDADTGERLDRDRGESPDARLWTCLGRTTNLRIVWTGAGGDVKVNDALFPLPKGVPGNWGPRAVGLLSEAVKKRLTRGPQLGPVWETLGAQGSLVTEVEVEPGRCYLAALALVKGRSNGLRLGAGAGPRTSTEEVPPGEEQAAVSFCAEQPDARLAVDAPGTSIGWVLALWPIGVEPGEGALELAP